MYEGKKRCMILVGKPEGNRALDDADVDGKIILRRIFRKWDWSKDWIALAQVAGTC